MSPPHGTGRGVMLRWAVTVTLVQAPVQMFEFGHTRVDGNAKKIETGLNVWSWVLR